VVKIKCCGMTNLDDCKLAEDLGADLVGFVFYKKSKRWVSPVAVRRITGKLGKSISKVGVFVEEDDREIAEIMDHCGLDFAQVYRASALLATIRVFRVARKVSEPVPDEGLCLFDSAGDGFGGSGKPFDLTALPAERKLLERSFIAGGIDERNVTDVLRLKPYGVDLVSSLEANPGRKDPNKMERFIKTVRSFTL
jgi:phosphoribosylanthranilate isomerase